MDITCLFDRKRTLRQIEEHGFNDLNVEQLVCTLRHSVFGRLTCKLLLFVIGSLDKRNETELWVDFRKLFYMGSQLHAAVVISHRIKFDIFLKMKYFIDQEVG